MATIIPKKIKVDPLAAMQRLQGKANASAADRFSLASEITRHEPTGLTPLPLEPRSDTTGGQAFDPSRCVPGAIVSVPLHLIDLNELGPRQIYLIAEIDKIADTLAAGQDDAAHGYLKDGRVKLIDGGTRFRSAKVSGVDHLDVKFEPEPDSVLELYLRARSYNDKRSQPTAIDHAISLRKLMESGAVSSNKDISDKIPDPNGRPMSEAIVSMYMRVGRMPDRILQRMSESPLTTGISILYAVSDIFQKVQDLNDAEDMARSVIDDIRQKELSSKQINALVKSKLDGIKPRERSNQQAFNLGPYTGYVKVFTKRGQIELSMKGIPIEKLVDLQKKLIETVESFAKLQEGGETSKGK
ncbi:MAG: ParB/RepB/Spo0J family partition protein [Gammaproteobacteria bacterium]|nr:ParB/RepB/Spo0J family partition protein [Gammaproteobacteria bacterium]